MKQTLRRLSLALTALVATLPLPARAEEPGCTPAPLVVEGLGTPSAELERLLELRGALRDASSGTLRRGATTERVACTEVVLGPWAGRFERTGPRAALAPVPVRLTGVFRGESPGGPGDDGLLWEGRGFSTAARAGLRGSWGVLSGQLAPEITWSQNDWFQTVSTGQPGDRAHENPFYGEAFDQPQRFGAGPFGRATLGQSFVQVEAWGVQLGVSTENRWWGPGVRTSLTLSNNAEGFPHLYLGTARPVDIGIGTLEAQALWGAISRSRYFAHPETQRWRSGLAVVYGPRWVPGLSIGLSRSYVQTWEAMKDAHFLPFLKPQSNSENQPDDNQLASAWLRWVFPESGLELYGEFARDDAASFASFVRLPDRTGAWMIGLQKLFVAGPRWVRLTAELASTGEAEPAPYTVYFYTHANNVAYTHGGQPMGAWFGSGGDSQTLAVDVLSKGGRFGGFVERVRRNDAYFWNAIAGTDRGTDHDAEMSGGLRQVIYAGRVELSWEVSGGYRANRDFLDSEPVYRVATGLAVPLR
ncbi:MAG: capsule assembly Wzi family protein [Anaeromyxobacter sp.]